MLRNCVWGGRRSAMVLVCIIITLPVAIRIQPIWGDCVSSCGKISNITTPFRLKGDPNGCGDSKYELECINNSTVLLLRIFSAEFYVQSVNYNNYTIRLVDPNFHQSNCSSLPRYFLHQYNFTDFNANPRTVDARFSPGRSTVSQYEGTYTTTISNVIYLYCTNQESRDNGGYVKTSPCLDPHILAIPGDISLGSLDVGCHVMATTPWLWSDSNYGGNLTYMDIYRRLVFGFELSWLNYPCQRSCGSSSCHFNDTSRQIQCDTHFCHYLYLTTNQCGILIKSLKYTQAILNSILDGIYYAITLRTPTDTVEDSSVPFYPYLIDIISYARYGFQLLVVARFLIGVIFLAALLIYKWRRRHFSLYDNIEHFLQDTDLAPIRYSYKEIKKMARGFNDKLGQGGFGTVYKGKLRSGPYVAIKMLGKSKASGQEFISEVATIGRIHHAYVVRLIGYCVEGSKRAIVYEFMPKGSLDRYIFCKEGSVPLSYEKIHEIALKVAQGIAYLHHGCDMKILHFDIKPHNILLDDNFIPKVSDFGLAKLYPADDSIVMTAAKGTIGYMAPELFYKNLGGVSYKADVYSFGMLLMEMASRRRNLNQSTENSSQLYFPLWIYDQFTEEKDIEIEDLTEEERVLAKRMFIVALWCIQLKPIDRPSMNKVVEMLEAQVESLEMPPKPSLYPQETVAQDRESNCNQTASRDSVQSSSYDSDAIHEDSFSSGER